MDIWLGELPVWVKNTTREFRRSVVITNGWAFCALFLAPLLT